jgi:hypothetical protein
MIYNWLGPFSDINPAYIDNALVVVLHERGYRPACVGAEPQGHTNSNGVMGGFTLARPQGFNFPVPWLGGGATVLSVGMNLFITVFDQNQRGVCPVTVVRMFDDPANPGTPVIAGVGDAIGIDSDRNAAFPGPSLYIPTLTFATGQFTTAGVHRFGYLIEYQTGFTTRASPDSGATSIPTVGSFLPIVVNVSATNLISFVFGANWASPELGGITAISYCDGYHQTNQYS